MQAAVADLKAHLSAYLKRVKAGQEVMVTERGRPIARLVPITPAELKKGRLAQLAEEGLVQLGRSRRPKALLVPPEAGDAPSGVLAALLADRSEGR